MVYADIRVHGLGREELVSFIRICSIIQKSGMLGSGVTIPVVVDGDGSGHMTFEVKDEDTGGFVKLPDYEGSLDDIEKQWIGE